VCLVTVLYGL